MEGLLKQTRSRFSRRDQPDSRREGRSPQRTGSFREKKPQKWFWKQSSPQMSFNNTCEEDEYAAAVAATALAISSLESEEAYRRNVPTTQSSLPRIRSNIEDTGAGMPFLGEQLPRSPERSEMVPEKTIHPVPTINRTPTMGKKRLSFADQLTEDLAKAPPSVERTPTVKRTSTFDDDEFENGGRIRPPRRTPTVKKTPSYSETTFNDGQRMKPDFSAPKQDLPPPPTLSTPIPPLSVQPWVPPMGARRPVDQETDAEAWEREQMAKIKQKYEKMNATILEWEDNKRKKARRKLETAESNVEKRRAKAMQKYQIEMEHIKQIADGARAQAKEKQRNEESKVMEKANRYEQLNGTIAEWEEKKRNNAKRKLETKQGELENKRTKAMQKYQNEVKQIKQIANGAKEQAKSNYRNEELKVKEKANRYRATGEVPPAPLCACL